MAIPLRRSRVPIGPPPQSCHAGARAEADHGLGPIRLRDFYNQHFEFRRAKTSEDLEAVFRLRYEVYCLENPFEDPKANPGGMETDAYDETALHSILLHRATGEVVGTVRLILPMTVDTGMNLPIRDICHHELLERDNPVLPWAGTAEISRFAVSKKLRQRATDRSVAGGELPPDNDKRRRIPDTSLGLMQAVIAMASESGVSHLCAVMEPSLLRMLRRLGMDFPSLGPEVNYHGLRQPCYVHLDLGLAKTWLARRDVWELLTQDGALWPVNMDCVRRVRASGCYLEASPSASPA